MRQREPIPLSHFLLHVVFFLVIIVNLFQLFVNHALWLVKFAEINLKGVLVIHFVMIFDDQVKLRATNAAVGAFESNLVTVLKRYHISHSGVVVEHKTIFSNSKCRNATIGLARFFEVLKYRKDNTQSYQEVGDEEYIAMPVGEHKRKIPMDVAKHSESDQ